MSTLVKANRLTIKRYTENDKNSAWDKTMQAKQLLAEAFNKEDNKFLVRRALELYEESLEIYPDYAETYMGIAYISFISDDIINAIAFLHNALYIDSQNKDALNMMEYFKKGLENEIQSHTVKKEANKTLEKVMEMKMPTPSKVMASKGFLTSVKKAFSW